MCQHPLPSLYPRLFILSLNHNGPVTDLSCTPPCWRIGICFLRRNIMDSEIQYLLELLEVILFIIRVSYLQNLAPSLISSWLNLSVTPYLLLPPFPYRYRLVWLPAAPLKVKPFVWEATWGNLYTADRLQKMSPTKGLSPQICHMCHTNSSPLISTWITGLSYASRSLMWAEFYW